MVILFNGGGAEGVYSSAREKKRERRTRAFVGSKGGRKREKCAGFALGRAKDGPGILYWPRRLIVSMAFTIP